MDRPFETGPEGDVYSCFYDYSPDLDQFVSSSLLEGIYPPEYLSANLNALTGNAALALKYGLVPGLHINSPRSMPEAFWSRYPFLRGARIDHPRESFLPRYTLAMAHPVVQQHYRELVQKIFASVPELGFIHVWTNDSGSGFEYVTSLYAGRNGGPYLLREWKKDDEIARVAANNVLTYFRLLRDEGRRVNPALKVICDLGSFAAERKYLLPHFGDGLDAGAFGSFEGAESEEERSRMARAGITVHEKLDTGDCIVPGVPCPLLVFERLQSAARRGATHILTGATPRSLAPFDVNGEIVRSFQLDANCSPDQILTKTAGQWVGPEHASGLVHLWKLSDTAVRSYPAGVPYSTFAFPWFRLWVRPFVPDIGAIPESDRSYYERWMLATFNNPARVDLNNDMMWNFLTVKEAGAKKDIIDHAVLPKLSEAIDSAASLLKNFPPGAQAGRVIEDLRDRLRAARCYYATMRNSLAWTESVHGYCESSTPDDTERYRQMCRSMVLHELANARELLALWRESSVAWMPVSSHSETLHIYGENFGEHLERKILLMEQHINDEPYIDPEYMWQMPAVRVSES